MPAKTNKNILPDREWNYPAAGKDISFEPEHVSIFASKQECAAICERLDLIDLKSLSAELDLQRINGGHIVQVLGTFNAQVTQECVVTLDKVDKEVHGQVEGYYSNPEEAVSFVAASRKMKQKGEKGETRVLEEWEDPEHMEGGMIDLGELVVQHLSLALETFPHKPGISYEEGDEHEELRKASDLRRNPFAALQYWSDKNNNEDSS